MLGINLRAVWSRICTLFFKFILFEQSLPAFLFPLAVDLRWCERLQTVKSFNSLVAHAEQVINEFEREGKASAVSYGQYMHAIRVKEAVCHPDTGKPILLPLRVCCILPANLLLDFCMISAAATGSLRWQVGAQWLNQTYLLTFSRVACRGGGCTLAHSVSARNGSDATLTCLGTTYATTMQTETPQTTEATLKYSQPTQVLLYHPSAQLWG